MVTQSTLFVPGQINTDPMASFLVRMLIRVTRVKDSCGAQGLPGASDLYKTISEFALRKALV